MLRPARPSRIEHGCEHNDPVQNAEAIRSLVDFDDCGMSLLLPEGSLLDMQDALWSNLSVCKYTFSCAISCAIISWSSFKRLHEISSEKFCLHHCAVQASEAALSPRDKMVSMLLSRTVQSHYDQQQERKDFQALAAL